jgi:hypothetical protein
MKSTSIWQRFSAVALLAATLGGTGAVLGGCAYAGVASTPDGTVVITRNGLFGAVRKVFICKVAGTALNCTESDGP